jgi:hypothetical protein
MKFSLHFRGNEKPGDKKRSDEPEKKKVAPSEQ